jgi:hypothetical protein
MLLTYALFIWYLQFRKLRRESKNSRTWPTVQGEITTKGIHTQESHDEDGTSYSHSGFVNYSYNVNNIDYTGWRVKMGVTVYGPSLGRANKSISDNKVGDIVTVHYNPDNPEKAVLQLGLNRRWIIFPQIILLISIPVISIMLLSENPVYSFITYIVWLFVPIIVLGPILGLILLMIRQTNQSGHLSYKSILAKQKDLPNFSENLTMLLNRPGMKTHMRENPQYIESFIEYPEFHEWLQKNKDLLEFYENHPDYNHYLRNQN